MEIKCPKMFWKRLNENIFFAEKFHPNTENRKISVHSIPLQLTDFYQKCSVCNASFNFGINPKRVGLSKCIFGLFMCYLIKLLLMTGGNDTRVLKFSGPPLRHMGSMEEIPTLHKNVGKSSVLPWMRGTWKIWATHSNCMRSTIDSCAMGYSVITRTNLPSFKYLDELLWIH